MQNVINVADFKGKKVLIVEDDEVLRSLYVELLTTEGALVDEAPDGETGWRKIHQGGYNLVILDIVLPKKDGMEILRQFQKNKSKEANGPIVILTNLGQDLIINQGFSLGAAGYIIKSAFNPDQVLGELKNFLTKK